MQKRSTSFFLSSDLFFLGIALILHSFVFLLPSKWFESPPPKVSKKTLSVSSVPRRSKFRPSSRQRQQKIKRKVIEKKKKKKEEKEKPLRGQVVDVAPTKDNRPLKDAKFLSEYNTRVKKQTISKNRRLKYKVAMKELTRKKKAQHKRKPKYLSKNVSVQDNRTLKKGQKSKKKKRQKVAMLGFQGKEKKLKLPKLTQKKGKQLQKGKTGVFKQKKSAPIELPSMFKELRLSVGPLSLRKKVDPSEQGSQQGKKSGTAHRKLPDIYDLVPNLGKMSRIQGAPAPDHLKDIDVGDQTQLNTRFHKYSSFFNRVKKSVAEQWSPGGLYQRRDPYGNVYGTLDRYTLVQVVLDKAGTIQEVSVKKTSGVAFLDKEAMDAFKRVAVFPNPPLGLLNSNGKIQFSFGFFLQVSNRPKFLFFR